MRMHTLAARREVALVMARWSSRRLATCETHFFRAAVRHSRTGLARHRALRERWRRLAVEFGEFLEDACRELVGLGMGEAAEAFATEAGHRVGKARHDHARALGLDPRMVARMPLAVETSSPPFPFVGAN